MPTYVYKFEDGATIEIRQSMEEKPLKALYHPVTGDYEAVKRVPSKTSIILKGSGFAKNDHRKKS